MHFTEQEIGELGINQLTPEEIGKAKIAMNGLIDEFSREWVTQHFQGGKAASFVRQITSIWDDWSLVKRLSRSDSIRARWSLGIHNEGVTTELFIIASLMRAGAEVELFPPSNGRVPDCRFRFDVNDIWTYAEISKRQMSELLRRSHEAINKISVAASKVIQGMHGKVALLKLPSDEELREILEWISAIRQPNEMNLRDLAVFYADPIDSPSDTTQRIDELLTAQHLFGVHFAIDHGITTKKGTTAVSVDDQSAQQMLESEAAQLPREFPNVIFLNISSVLGGLDKWEPLIRRRLQPNINTRIGAVVLFQWSLAAEGLLTEGTVIVNPYAMHRISEKIINEIQTFLPPPSRNNPISS